MTCERRVRSTVLACLLPCVSVVWLVGMAAAQESAPEQSPPTTLLPISGPQELLSLYGVDPERLDVLADGRPLAGDEQEVLLRTFLAIRKFDVLELHDWTLDDRTWRDLADNTDAHRGQILALAGRVVFVEAFQPEPEDAERFELEEYFRCDVLLGEDESPAVIYALDIPKAWPRGEAIDERISAQGFFLKFAENEPQPNVPVFASLHVAWHAQTVLGDLGMDVGLFDDVTHRTSITSAERECFYQMLYAARRAGTNELLRRTNQKYSVVPLFNAPEQQMGELVALSGTARRAVRIRVEAEDIVRRFGIDHYYEVSLFTEDSQDNPLTFCVLQLPEGMPEGDRIHEAVRVAGFFFKTWGYVRPPAPGEEQGPDTVRRQLTPLLIGRQPILLRDDSAGSPYLGLIFSGLFVLALLALWILVWWFNRVDNAFVRRAIHPQFALEKGTSLNELGLEVVGPPDFSHLAQEPSADVAGELPPAGSAAPEEGTNGAPPLPTDGETTEPSEGDIRRENE